MSDVKSIAGVGLRHVRSPLWLRIAQSWAARCRFGQITIVAPNGVSTLFRGTEPGPTATIELHNGRPIWRTVMSGDLGFGESFVDDDWSSPDIAAVVEFALRNEESLARQILGSWASRLLSNLHFRRQANSRAGARRNIAYHYDLGNDFYAEWLDETMTYSSGLFASSATTLVDAQREKYRRIVDALRIGPDARVLEIGCGWGGFAEFAARETGARIVALTISNEQAAYARRRIGEAGLSDRVEIRVEDYRDVGGSFDKVVSIEMLEAVGAENWAIYFDVLRERLKPGGSAMLQVITVPDARFATYRKTVDFIQRHIFPGGMLPSPGTLSASAASAGLKLGDVRFFGADYAETLRLWSERFETRWNVIRELGFDDRFYRTWTFYLRYAEAGFRAGAIDVGHFLIERR